jgi:hypothetical protein
MAAARVLVPLPAGGGAAGALEVDAALLARLEVEFRELKSKGAARLNAARHARARREN